MYIPPKRNNFRIPSLPFFSSFTILSAHQVSLTFAADENKRCYYQETEETITINIADINLLELHQILQRKSKPEQFYTRNLF